MHSYPSHTGLSSLLSQASLVLSVSLKRKETGRREEQRWRKDVRVEARRAGKNDER